MAGLVAPGKCLPSDGAFCPSVCLSVQPPLPAAFFQAAHVSFPALIDLFSKYFRELVSSMAGLLNVQGAALGSGSAFRSWQPNEPGSGGGGAPRNA